MLGGLVPELLCAASGWRHAGTTDVDVQVDLEVACGAVNTARLENALRTAEFEPDTDRVWHWVADGTDVRTVVKFELLADLDTEPNQATVRFDVSSRYANRSVSVMRRWDPTLRDGRTPSSISFTTVGRDTCNAVAACWVATSRDVRTTVAASRELPAQR